jgi:hypothetical protein
LPVLVRNFSRAAIAGSVAATGLPPTAGPPLLLELQAATTASELPATNN